MKEVKTKKSVEEVGKSLSDTLSSAAKSIQSFKIPDFNFKIPSIYDDISILHDDEHWEQVAESIGKKNREEAEIRRLQLEVLRKQINDTTPKNPLYNIKTSVLTFAGTNIQIPLNTKQESLCKVILKSREAMEKQWSWDEICEEWENEPDENQRGIIYRAGKRVRDLVARKTGIPDFLIVTTKTIQVHPLYLSS